MNTRPYVDGEVPPRSFILGKYPDGSLFWFRPEDVQLGPSPNKQTLSEEQRQRVTQFKEILGVNDRTSLEETIENFERDANPESELRIWEAVAGVYEAELKERGHTTARERQLVYRAALRCSLGPPTVDALLATEPELKGLSNLARVVERYRNTGGSPEIQALGEKFQRLCIEAVEASGGLDPSRVEPFVQAFMRFKNGGGGVDAVVAAYRELVEATADGEERARLLCATETIEKLAHEIEARRRDG
jgi:hypothetical protein